jgi:hypothetical protein
MQRTPIRSSRQFTIQFPGAGSRGFLGDRQECIQPRIQFRDLILALVSQFHARHAPRPERISGFPNRHEPIPGSSW